MKTESEINRYFTEEVFGKCWHKSNFLATVNNRFSFCQYISNPDYFSKEGFWDIWDLLFSDNFDYDGFMRATMSIPFESKFHYSRLAREVYDFLEGKK